MHKHCFWLGALVVSLSVGTACWAQTPGSVRPVRSGTGDAAYVVLIGREVCDQVSPGFRAATDPGYERWRSENAAAIATLEASAEFQTALARTRQSMKNPGAKELSQMKDLCDGLREAFEARPRDSRLATPSKTWDLFLTSLRAADRATADRCLTGRARSVFRESIVQLPDDKLRDMGNGFAKFGITDTFSRGGLKEGFAVHQDGQGYLIYFEERNGEWRISEM